MDINALVIFHKVAETNSFSTSSRILEIPISTISRKINKLEKDLKHKLFIRTTRKINLTPEGQLLYNSSKQLFEEFNSLGTLFEKDSDVSGDIRITSTIEHKFFLAPKIVEFRKKYPNINIFINFSNDVKDMIENSYDFAFRAGNLKNSSAYAHQLYTDKMHAYIYKDFFPSNLSLESLAEFDCCMLENHPVFKTIKGEILKPKKKIVTNSIEFMLEYAKYQASIVYLPESHATKDYMKLNIFETNQTSFQIVYLHKKLNRACSLFLDFFKNVKIETPLSLKPL